jgi:hypothetical protein
MQLVEELDSETIERLGKQREFLLMVHQAELAKDPASHATESARSNLMAAQHTIRQVYAGRRLREKWPISLHRPRLSSIRLVTP